MREGLQVEQPTTGYAEMALRTGVHYGDDVARTPTTRECPDGVVFRRTKYLGPFGYPDAFLVNVAKHKTHTMGLTLCVKNLQGMNVPPYIRFCGGVNQPAIAADLQPDAQRHVEALYEKHLKAGMPRWEAAKGLYMEMWAQRTIDHYKLIQPSVGLHVIEGIYAQNGDAFDGGPGPSGLPEVFMTNVLVFGKDAFRLDIVGHWLGGHEPGNFGLFHLARERGVSTALDPRNIPVYAWEDDGPKLTPLERFERVRLLTPYLEKPGEARFHMVDEPYAYPAEAKAACLSGGDGRASARSARAARCPAGPRSPPSTGSPRAGRCASTSTTPAGHGSASSRRAGCRGACTRAPGGPRVSPRGPTGGGCGPTASTCCGRRSWGPERRGPRSGVLRSTAPACPVAARRTRSAAGPRPRRGGRAARCRRCAAPRRVT